MKHNEIGNEQLNEETEEEDLDDSAASSKFDEK